MPKSCEYCGADNPAAARFCRQCGQAVGGSLVRSATQVTPLMKQWRMLARRMTRKEVRRLLGEPMRVETGDAQGTACENWVYEYEATSQPTERLTGRVSFLAADGTVFSWIEPDWHKLG